MAFDMAGGDCKCSSISSDGAPFYNDDLFISCQVSAEKIGESQQADGRISKGQKGQSGGSGCQGTGS